jgi:hypothetical protein
VDTRQTIRNSSSTINLPSNPDSAVAFQSPALSPASTTLSRKSSRVSFSDYDDIHAYNPHQRALTYPQKYTTKDPTDHDHFDIATETAKRKKARNKTLLYAGLACITTVAASNNIYQSTKAHMGRRYEIQKGEMDLHEATRFRKKGLVMDLFSAGVGAICINNTFKGWQRYEALKQEEKKAEALLRRKARDRRKEEEAEEGYFEAVR